MTDNTPEKTSIRVVDKAKKKRRHLPAVIRYLIISTCGAILSLLVFYLLRKAGY